MVIKEESGLKFGFPEKSIVIKFDDTLFYRDYFNRFPGSKGVRFCFCKSESDCIYRGEKLQRR